MEAGAAVTAPPCFSESRSVNENENVNCKALPLDQICRFVFLVKEVYSPRDAPVVCVPHAKAFRSPAWDLTICLEAILGCR